jgi:hypothetical protein
MRLGLQIAGAAALLAVLGARVDAGEIGQPLIVSPPAIERPEIRSYQPYSGLQFDFRPEPPGERGIRPKRETRPRVVMPVPVSPLIEYGQSNPDASQYYRYCGRNTRCR